MGAAAETAETCSPRPWGRATRSPLCRPRHLKEALSSSRALPSSRVRPWASSHIRCSSFHPKITRTRRTDRWRTATVTPLATSCTTAGLPRTVNHPSRRRRTTTRTHRCTLNRRLPWPRSAGTPAYSRRSRTPTNDRRRSLTARPSARFCSTKYRPFRIFSSNSNSPPAAQGAPLPLGCRTG